MITTIQTLSKLDALHSLQLQNVTIPKIDFNSTQPKIIEQATNNSITEPEERISFGLENETLGLSNLTVPESEPMVAENPVETSTQLSDEDIAAEEDESSALDQLIPIEPEEQHDAVAPEQLVKDLK